MERGRTLLQPGSVLQGRFVIERVLGQGGMGAVYLAHQQALGEKRVAIKEMMVTVRDAGLREQAVMQFQREAHILASLDHPGLVKVIDFFTEEGGQYLVMDLVSGRTLEQVVNERFDYPAVAEVMGWMDQVCDVLEFLHTRRPPVLVRDLKPDNIMVDDAGRIRLIDFGIARVLEPQVSTNTFLRGSGTPGYAPIEQYGGRTDARTDIYALGATLYSVLTREVPPASVLRMSGEETLVRPSLFNPAISVAMEAAILRMMAVYRDDRHASMAEVRQALEVARLDPPGEERFRFCTQCGTPRRSLDGPCSSCGARLEPGAISVLTRWLTDLTPLYAASGSSTQSPPHGAASSAWPVAVPGSGDPARTLPPITVPGSGGQARTVPPVALPGSGGQGSRTTPPGLSAVAPGPGKGARSPHASSSGEMPVSHLRPFPVPSTPDTVLPGAASATSGVATHTNPVIETRPFAQATQPAVPPPVEPVARSHASLVAAAADAEGGRRSKIRVLPILILTAVLTLAGLGAIRAVRHARFQPGPAIATLMVSSEPPGAVLKVDGSNLGFTPQRVLSLGLGSHELRLTCDDYEAETVTLQVQPPDVPGGHARMRVVTPRGKLLGTFEQVGSQGRLSLALRSVNGEVVVDVKPNGGDLVVDGHVLQRTVLSGARVPLPPGRHMLEMQRADYTSVKRTVDIRRGQSVTWSDSMKSLLCSVTFKTPRGGAHVYLDGSRVGSTPLVLDSVRPGSHLARFERPGFEPADVKFTLPASSQKVVSTALAPVKGEVALDVEPSGFTVLVDGKNRGADVATGARLKLHPGRHRVQLQKSGYHSLSQVVDVKASSTVTLKGRFELQMASVTVNSAPSDAWVMVNGRAVGRTPLSLPRVPPGTYQLKVWKNGFAVYERSVTLAAGTTEALTVPLVRVTTASNPNRNPMNKGPRYNPTRNPFPGQRRPWRGPGQRWR